MDPRTCRGTFFVRRLPPSFSSRSASFHSSADVINPQAALSSSGSSPFKLHSHARPFLLLRPAFKPSKRGGEWVHPTRARVLKNYLYTRYAEC